MFALSLGCGIGYGYLHRIPAHTDVSTEKPSTPPPEEEPSPNLPSHGFTEVHISVSYMLHMDIKTNSAATDCCDRSLLAVTICTVTIWTVKQEKTSTLKNYS